MQARGQQLNSMDRRAVINQLSALVALGSLFRNVSFARQHKICQLLPVLFPVRPLRLQRLISLVQTRNERINLYHYIIP